MEIYSQNLPIYVACIFIKKTIISYLFPFYVHLLSVLLIMSIGDLLYFCTSTFVWFFYFFIIPSVYMLCFTKLCEFFAGKTLGKSNSVLTKLVISSYFEIWHLKFNTWQYYQMKALFKRISKWADFFSPAVPVLEICAFKVQKVRSF